MGESTGVGCQETGTLAPAAPRTCCGACPHPSRTPDSDSSSSKLPQTHQLRLPPRAAVGIKSGQGWAGAFRGLQPWTEVGGSLGRDRVSVPARGHVCVREHVEQGLKLTKSTGFLTCLGKSLVADSQGLQGQAPLGQRGEISWWREKRRGSLR